ncbi:hypothetical protein GO613_13865 [Azoarcus communis]|uniref:hypothetical protein n=1 Tax=Parazoarcus communis TaxID=41977 RepID=UPI001459530C|nr:hypothetical protein [Parazoarcus communis]NMG49190.1 hypothetical protein [Parazoarcus communis]
MSTNISRSYLKNPEFLSRQLKLELMAAISQVGINALGVARVALSKAIRGIDRVHGVKGPERTARMLREVLLPFFGKEDTARIGRILAGGTV